MDQKDPQTYAIIGAAMEAHGVLGPGFLEAVYQEALALEFESRAIQFNREVELKIFYKNMELQNRYQVDFICYGNVLVELKALKQLTSIEEAKTLNYLKAGRINKGLLINFGAPSLEFKRFIWDPITKKAAWD